MAELIAAARPARQQLPTPADEDVSVATPPSRPEPQPIGTSVVQMLFPVLGSVGSLIFILANPKPITIVGGLVFMLGSVAMGATMFFTQRSAQQRGLRRHRAAYLSHLEAVRGRLRAAIRAQSDAERLRHPSPGQLPDLARNPARRFERRPGDEDFLRVRLGLGDQPRRVRLAVQLDDSPTTSYDPVCLAAVRRLVTQHETLNNQPVPVDLTSAGVVSFVGDYAAARQVLASLLLSAACLHAPGELTIGACAAPEPMAFWQWLRWLPHCRAAAPDAHGVARRHLAASVEELSELLEEPVTEVLAGSSRHRRVGPARPDRHVLAVIDATRLATHTGFRVGGSETPPPGDGVSVIYLLASTAQEPARVDIRVRVQADGGCLVEYPAARPPRPPVPLHGDQVTQVDAEAVARCLAPVGGPVAEQSSALADEVDVADLLGTGDIGTLDPVLDLATPPGPGLPAGTDRRR